MNERTYVLGTHDAEVERLGVQHAVWRDRALACWRRAGITAGSRVIDVGSGPGHAAADLGTLVGERGSVLGLERSERFVAAGRQLAGQRGLANVEFRAMDIETDEWGIREADAAWCRWVLAFVKDPGVVVRRIATALRPEGVAAFHEYFDYRTWRLSPRSRAFEEFVALVMRNWRESGGEPDIGLDLPRMLAEAGFSVLAMEPVVYVVRPGDAMWQWPDTFVRVHLEHLVETGRVEKPWARAVRRAFEEAVHAPGAFLVTPAVLEVIARKTAHAAA